MVIPPAITIQVKQLEETIRFRLLVRDGNSVRLTDAWISVFKRAEKIFQEIGIISFFRFYFWSISVIILVLRIIPAPL